MYRINPKSMSYPGKIGIVGAAKLITNFSSSYKRGHISGSTYGLVTANLIERGLENELLDRINRVVEPMNSVAFSMRWESKVG